MDTIWKVRKARACRRYETRKKNGNSLWIYQYVEKRLISRITVPNIRNIQPIVSRQVFKLCRKVHKKDGRLLWNLVNIGIPT